MRDQQCGIQLDIKVKPPHTYAKGACLVFLELDICAVLVKHHSFPTAWTGWMNVTNDKALVYYRAGFLQEVSEDKQTATM